MTVNRSNHNDSMFIRKSILFYLIYSPWQKRSVIPIASHRWTQHATSPFAFKRVLRQIASRVWTWWGCFPHGCVLSLPWSAQGGTLVWLLHSKEVEEGWNQQLAADGWKLKDPRGTESCRRIYSMYWDAGVVFKMLLNVVMKIIWSTCQCKKYF